MPLHEGEGFSATFSPFFTSSSRLEWFIWIGWKTLSVYTLSVLSAWNSGQWCGQECISTEVREFWYHKMGDLWKEKGLPGKLFFTQFGCGWAVDEYFQPSWLFVLKQVWVLLPDSHWGEWPVWDAATPWHITPDLLLCLVGKHPLLCFAIILLDTGVSNNNRNHQVSLCRKN